MDSYNYIKSLHLIFVITWFAGLFYIPRIFIYHIESSQKASPDKEILSTQMKLMAKRLWYIITWPSAISYSLWSLAFGLSTHLARTVLDACKVRVCGIAHYVSHQNTSYF